MKTSRLSAEQEAEKLPASVPRQSWNKLWDFHTSTCSLANRWKDYHPTTSSPNKTKKVHPFHQTSFPIWTPPWRRACSTVCEGGNLGNKNWALGLVLHLVITSLYVGHVILCVSVYLNIIIVISIYSLLTSGRFPPKRRFLQDIPVRRLHGKSGVAQVIHKPQPFSINWTTPSSVVNEPSCNMKPWNKCKWQGHAKHSPIDQILAEPNMCNLQSLISY